MPHTTRPAQLTSISLHSHASLPRPLCAALSFLAAQTSSLPSHVASVRSSIASTQWGSWIRSKGSVDSTSEQQDQLSPQEAREVEQATAFLKELEADYQRFVADMNKRRQSEAEMAEIDESRKS